MRLLITLSLCIWIFPCWAQIQFEEVSGKMDIPPITGNFGIAVGDFNNDGFDDIFLARKSPDQSNCLYQNVNGEYFEDVSYLIDDNSKTTKTAHWVDIDANGWLDLIIVNWGKENKVVYLNYGNNIFSEAPTAFNITDNFDSQSVNAADLNGDGYIDIYFNNFRQSNTLYQYTELGLTNKIGTSSANSFDNAMGVLIADFDDDLDQDIYVIHDGQTFIYYENDGTGAFSDRTKEIGLDVLGYGMGIDLSDIDRDGDFDLYITNNGANFFLQKNEDGIYQRKEIEMQVGDEGMGWGTNFIDVDNDGYDDLYVTNQHNFLPIENALFHNRKGAYFNKIDSEILASPYDGYASAVADIDDDGRLDIIVANYNHHPEIFKNVSKSGNYVKFRLLQRQKNTRAIGARVSLYNHGIAYTKQIISGSGFLAQSSTDLHFGVDTIRTIDSAVVFWPDGVRESFHNLEVNQRYLIVKNEQIKFFTSEDMTSFYQASLLAVRDKEGIIVFPNPASEQIFLRVDYLGEKKVLLYDITGKKVKEASFLGKQDIMDLSEIERGYYLLHILLPDGFRKIIKIKVD